MSMFLNLMGIVGFVRLFEGSRKVSSIEFSLPTNAKAVFNALRHRLAEMSLLVPGTFLSFVLSSSFASVPSCRNLWAGISCDQTLLMSKCQPIGQHIDNRVIAATKRIKYKRMMMFLRLAGEVCVKIDNDELALASN